LWWILNPVFGTYSLLLIQAFFVIIGGYFTYLFVKDKTGSQFYGILAFLHYNLLWGHYSAVTCEYIDATVAACMVPAFLFFFHQKRVIPAALSFLFVLTSRENMSIWLMFIAVFLFIEYYKDFKQRMAAIAVLAISVCYLIAVKTILIPHFEHPQSGYLGFAYSALGPDIPQAISFIVTHPLESIRLLFVNHSGLPAFDGIKLEFWYVFLISGGIFVILKPHYALLLIPVIAQKLFNDHFVRWGILIFYSIEVVSVLTIAAIIPISRVFKGNWAKAMVILLCFLTAGITMVKMNFRVSKWYAKNKECFYCREFYSAPYTIADLKEPLSLIPADARVAATESLLPHLAQRAYISIYPYGNQYDYILLLADAATYPFTPEELEEKKLMLYASNEWITIWDKYPLTIFKRFGVDPSLHSEFKNDSSWNIKNKLAGDTVLHLVCDAENVSTLYPELLKTSSPKHYSIGTSMRSEITALSGSHSLEIGKDRPYGFSTTIPFVEHCNVTVKVWRKGSNGDGLLVISGKGDDNLYLTKGKGSGIFKGEWEEVSLSVNIGRNKLVESLSIYVWNVTENITYFDDFEIVVKRLE
jgi:uncharacterized membrane protein